MRSFCVCGGGGYGVGVCGGVMNDGERDDVMYVSAYLSVYTYNAV